MLLPNISGAPQPLAFTMTGSVGVSVPVAATVAASTGRIGNIGVSVGVQAAVQFQIVQRYTITPTGGVIIGGTAPAVLQQPNFYTIPVSGGALIGGAAVVTDNIAFVPTGGAVVGGGAIISSLSVNIFSIVSAGGVIVSGAPLIQDAIVYIPTGGVNVGGGAAISDLFVSIFNITPSGGVVASGAAPNAWSSSFVPTGGALVSGIAPNSIVATIPVAGGVLVSGAAPNSIAFAIPVSGGVTVNGAAVVHDYQAFFAPSGGLTIGGVALVSFFNGDISATTENPFGNVFPGWAINYETYAPSRYRDLPANSITLFQGVPYVANAGGIYALDAADDAGQPIKASVAMPTADFKTSREKRMEVAYLGLRSTGAMRVKFTAGTQSAIYPVVTQSVTTSPKGTRVVVGKGLVGRYWGVRIDNISGSSFALTNAELVPVAAQRRGV